MSAASYPRPGSSCSSLISATRPPARRRAFPDSLEALADPAGEDQEPERQGEIGERQPPDQDVDRRELPRNVGRHDRRRQHLADARRAGRRREVEQEHHQRLDQQDVHEMGVDAERAERDVAREQLVRVRGPGEHRRPEHREPAARAVERHDAGVRLVDPLPQPLEPVRHPAAPAPDGFGGPVNQARDGAGEEDHDRHQHADPGHDGEAAEEEIVEREAQQVAALSQRPSRPGHHRERTGDREEQDGADEAHERRGDRDRERYAVPPHGVHRHRPRARIERRDVPGPGSHPAREDAPFERRPREDVPGADPEPQASADPVQGGQRQAHEHPCPSGSGRCRRRTPRDRCHTRSVIPKPTSEASTENSNPRTRNLGVRRRDMNGRR